MRHPAWEPVDLSAPLDGERPTPTLCTRTDGNSLIYEGFVHLLRGPSGAGKTMLAAVAAAQTLGGGRPVTWIDWVHNPTQVVSALRAVGATDQAIRERLTYIQPYTWGGWVATDDALCVIEDRTPIPSHVLALLGRSRTAWLITGLADDWMRSPDDELAARCDVHIHAVLHTRGGKRCRYRLLKDRPGGIRVPTGDQPPLADLWIEHRNHQLTPGRESVHEAGSKLEEHALEILRKSAGVDHDHLISLLGPVAKRDKDRLVQRLANEGRIVSRLDDGVRVWFVAGHPAVTEGENND